MLNKIEIVVRKAVNSDALQLLSIQTNSIRQLCNKHYIISKLEAWIETKSVKSYQDLTPNRYLVVATINDNVVGFGLLDLAKSSINGIYVDPTQVKKGCGKLLLTHLEDVAKKNSLPKLSLNATLNSVEFYKHLGYLEGNQSEHQLRDGTTLACIEMSKTFSCI